MFFRDSCYFCTSTFQLFAIISLAISRNEKADLYIDPDFDKASEYADNIRRANIFCNVILINAKEIYNEIYTHKNGLLYNIQTAKSYLNVEKISKMFLLKDICYNNMFFSSSAYFSRIAHFYFIKKKINTTINYFDDGIGSYLDNGAYKSRFLDRIIRRVLFGKQATSFHHTRFLFSCNTFRLLNPSNRDTIREIPRLWEDENCKRLLNDIFLASQRPVIKEKVVILDQPKNELFCDSRVSLLTELYRLIVKVVGKSNVVLKRHPRDKDLEMSFVNCFLDFGVPFELVCMNTDMNEKILISYASTAVVTPKLWLNQEPVIILLYKLFKTGIGRCEEELLDKFFYQIKSTYSEKRKVIIPEDIIELKDILLSLTN